jgi:hypothetical protein
VLRLLTAYAPHRACLLTERALKIFIAHLVAVRRDTSASSRLHDEVNAVRRRGASGRGASGRGAEALEETSTR